MTFSSTYLYQPILSVLLPGNCELLTKKNCFFFLLLDFGLSRLTSLQFIQYHVAGCYKLTIPQSPPSDLQEFTKKFSLGNKLSYACLDQIIFEPPSSNSGNGS